MTPQWHNNPNPPPPGWPTQTPPKSRTGVIVVLSLLLAAFIAATCVLAVLYATSSDDDSATSQADAQQSQAAAVDASRAEAVDVARKVATAMMSLDYRQPDAPAAAIAPLSTPEFAAKWRKTLDSSRTVYETSKVVTTGTVSHAAVERIDATTATVIVLAEQKTSSLIAPQGSTTKTQLIVELNRVDGKWLADDVTVI